jgi:predicted metal-dependent hydrolase
LSHGNHFLLNQILPNVTLTNHENLYSKAFACSDSTLFAFDVANDTNEIDILKKVKAKAPWILKQIVHFNSFRPVTPPRRFINGETHLYLGRQYRLKIISDTVNVIKAYRGQLCIHSKNRTKDTLN